MWNVKKVGCLHGNGVEVQIVDTVIIHNWIYGVLSDSELRGLIWYLESLLRSSKPLFLTTDKNNDFLVLKITELNRQ